MIELDRQQRAAATTDAKIAFVSAGPGAGKTRIIAGRVAHLVTDCGVRGMQIAALTYTRAMATDLKRRVMAALPELIPCDACNGTGLIGTFECAQCLGQKGFAPSQPKIGTLHSLAAGWVRAALRGEIAGGPEVLALQWVTTADFGIAQPEDVDDLVEVAYQEYRKKVTKRDLRAGLRVTGSDVVPYTAKTEARRQLALRGMVTFADLLVMLKCVVAAPRNRGPLGAGNGQPPHLADLVPNLILDEAQDFSPLHWAIVDLWAPKTLMAAGDDAQSIFGFLHEETRPEYPDVPVFQDRLAGAAARFEAGVNYRSVAPIVTACREVRRQIAAGGACSDLDLQAVRVNLPCEVTIEHCDSSATSGAAYQVQGLLDVWHPAAGPRHFQPEEIAVLARTWAELETIGDELAALGIPYAIPERGRDRWRSLAGRAVVAMARAADRGVLDDHDARTIVRALGHANPAAVVDQAMVRAVADRHSLAVALDRHATARAGLPDGWWPLMLKCKTTGLLALHIDDADVMGGSPLVTAARAMMMWEPISPAGFDEPDQPTPGEWLCWLASDESNCNVQMKPGHVVLTTVWGAKGLEWPAVVVVGASEGSMPGPYDKTPANIAEAGRVLYVAMTRARDVLRVICPETIREKPRNPSRWLVDAGLVNAPAVAG